MEATFPIFTCAGQNNGYFIAWEIEYFPGFFCTLPGTAGCCALHEDLSVEVFSNLTYSEMPLR